MVVANPANVSKTCVGGIVTASPGSNVIRYDPNFSDLDPTVAAFESCTLSVDVIGAAVGFHHNVSGELTSTSSRQDQTFVSSGKASATLEVVNDPILITKSFTDDPVPAGGTTTLQFTITNRSRDEVAENITFVDDLEATLPGLVSISPSQSNICGSGSTFEGTSVLKLSGGRLGIGASCTFSVSVEVPASAPSGTYLNRTSPIEADHGSNTVSGSPATDTLFVSPVPIFTKEFIDDPVTPGGMVTLKFTITNTSLNSDLVDIAFLDELPAELTTMVSLPPAGFCGAGSMITFSPPTSFDPAMLSMTGGSLKPLDTCTFSVVLGVAESASSGIATNTTEPLTAMIDGAEVTAPPASDDLVIVAGPQLSKSFLGPVMPGGTVLLEFEIAHGSEAPFDATNIAFTDNLDDVIPGMVALGLPRSNICGGGSFVRGTSVIDFGGGTLRPGETCIFTVPVRVPVEAPLGTVTNVTSPVSANLGGLAVASAPATAELLVTSLMLTKTFLSNPVIPGDTAILEFTITNAGSTTARNIAFTDDLDDALQGLVSVSGSQSDICGSGSQLLGTSLLVFQGGIVPGQSSCTFSVKVQVPASADEGDYINRTSDLTAEVGGSTVVLPPASALLSVTDTMLRIEKIFLVSPVLPGSTSSLQFRITNLATENSATNIAFTDALPSGLTRPGGTQSNVCGPGSQLSGSTTLSLTGGRLNAGASCTFAVPISVAVGLPFGTLQNVTSEVIGTINGLGVRGDPASANLIIAPPPEPDGSPQAPTGEKLPDGSVGIKWFGFSGRTYCIEKSGDLENWDPVPFSFIGEGELIEWEDREPSALRQFYRLVEKTPAPAP